MRERREHAPVAKQGGVGNGGGLLVPGGERIEGFTGGDRTLRELIRGAKTTHAPGSLAIGSDPTRARLAAVAEELDESQARNHGIRIDIQQARDCYGAIFIGISRGGEENPCLRPRPGSFAPGSRPAS